MPGSRCRTRRAWRCTRRSACGASASTSASVSSWAPGATSPGTRSGWWNPMARRRSRPPCLTSTSTDSRLAAPSSAPTWPRSPWTRRPHRPMLTATMGVFRYSRWDGSQQLPSFDADDVLDALSEDILAEGDVRRALQQLMQRGLRGTRGGDIPGLRRILERLRARRQEELANANLDGVLDDVNERLERILETERNGIERRLHDAEQRALDAPPGEEQDRARMAEQVMRRTARQRENRLDALPPNVAGRLNGLRDYEFMDDEARDAFNELTDELRQQMLQTYFQGLKEGVQRVTPEDLAGIRDMVRDLNQLLEKHATGADTTEDFAEFMGRHGQYFPPGIGNTDELIAHLHRQASQMASLLNSMSPEMRDELRSMMDDLLRDDRLRIDMARLAANLQAARPDLPYGEPYPFEGDEPMGLADALQAID